MAPRRSSSSATCDKRRVTNNKCKRRRPKRSPTQLAPKDCLFCDKTWPSYWHLEMHMNTHTKERPYECLYCDANFGFLAAQLTHQNNVHLGKRYSCNLCTKTFTVVSNLITHRRKEHHSQSKRAIFNGLQKVTKEIGILKGKRNKMKKVVEDKGLEVGKDAKMPVAPKKAVPTTSQLSSLVSSLQKVTQRKRKISGEEQVPENGVSVKHKRLNEKRSSEANEQEVKKETTEERNEEVAVEVKEETVEEVKDEVVEETEEECIEEVENFAEPLVTSSTSLQNDNHVITNGVVSIKDEENEDNQPSTRQQNASVTYTKEKQGSSKKKTCPKQFEELIPSTSGFPSIIKVPFGAATSPPQQPADIPNWHNRPPEPPPNLMFYFNGHTVPVLSLDILRNLARSNYRNVPLPTSSSPPASQSSSPSSSSDSDYTPRPSTSTRKQSTTSTKSSRKKSGPGPSSKSKSQSTKAEAKKTAKSRTKSSLMTTVTSATTKPKRRKPGSTSLAFRKRNYHNKCEQCDEVYKYPSQLVYHMRKHTGEKPFSCTFCGGRFTRQGNLVTHLANFHSQSQKDLETIKVEDVKPEGSES